MDLRYTLFADAELSADLSERGESGVTSCDDQAFAGRKRGNSRIDHALHFAQLRHLCRIGLVADHPVAEGGPTWCAGQRRIERHRRRSRKRQLDGAQFRIVKAGADRGRAVVGRFAQLLREPPARRIQAASVAASAFGNNIHAAKSVEHGTADDAA